MTNRISRLWTMSIFVILTAAGLHANGWICAHESFPEGEARSARDDAITICKRSCNEEWLHAITSGEKSLVSGCENQYAANKNNSGCYCWHEKSSQGFSERTYYNAQ